MIEIDNLVLRVPGFNEEEAKTIGEMVAARLAAYSWDHVLGPSVGRLDLSLEITEGSDTSELVNLVTEKIYNQLTSREGETL